MSSHADVLGSGALVVLVIMVGAWIVSLLVRDAGIVDIAWGLGVAAIAWTAACVGDGHGGRSDLLVALATISGVRVAAHQLWRTRGRGERRRYAAMRRAAGDAFPARSLVTVFVPRGVVLWIVALPVQLAMSPGAPDLGPLTVIGVTLWGIGLFLETVSGAQLARFTAEPGNDGALLRAGLWRAPFRPDRVGTLGAWWGIFLVAAETSDARLGVIGPILLSILQVRAVDGRRQLDVGMRADQREYGES